MLWILALLAIGTVAYLAIKGRIIRLQEEFQEELRRARKRPQSSLPSEDMTRCEVCGTYSAPSQKKDCGKKGCPYARVGLE
ncbi:MAG: hypothetical protein ACK6DM_12650 [Alphaproteobacteria bacterium]|jgi:hypothetical protein